MIEKLISSLLTFLMSLNVLPSNPAQIAQQNEAGRQITILFAGDVMLGRSVMGTTIDSGDFLYPFRKVADFTNNADITVVNLENAIIENCPRQGKGSFSFCTSPEVAQSLRYAGIDVVSLANNHSGNYGGKGLEETKKYLDEMGILWADGNKMAIVEKNGMKFGFLGFNYVYKNAKPQDLELIQESDKRVDVLVVFPHWGEEYTSMDNRLQTTAAQKFVEHGADLVIGSHPHWVQNDEIVNGVPVYYSLGNFVFDQMWSEETKKGKLVKLTFERSLGGERVGITKSEEFSSYIKNIGQPEIVGNF